MPVMIIAGTRNHQPESRSTSEARNVPTVRHSAPAVTMALAPTRP